MRLLITGCNGFVGRHLSRYCISLGHAVFGIDVHLSPLTADVVYGQLDIARQRDVEAFLTAHRVDAIVNLAGVSYPKQADDDPRGAVEANILGPVSLFEAARRFSGLRVLQIGSSEQYKEREGTSAPFREEDAVEPHNVYGATKIAAESIGRRYVDLYGAHVVFTRSFNHVGRGQPPLFVLSDFAKQCAEVALGRREPVLRVGNVDAERDFVDVQDVVSAYLALVQHAAPGHVYNVCSGVPLRLRDLIATLVSFTGRADVAIDVAQWKLRVADPRVVYGDSSKLRGGTGWQPRVPIEVSLRDMYDYWNEQITGSARG